MQDLLQPDELKVDPAAREEIQTLLSIFGEDTITVYDKPSRQEDASTTTFLKCHTGLPYPNGEIPLDILIILPETYPDVPPRLELLNKYIGDHAADVGIYEKVEAWFGTDGGESWTKREPVLFEGLEAVREICGEWYGERLSDLEVRRIGRQEEKEEAEAVVGAVIEKGRAQETVWTQPKDGIIKEFKVSVTEPIVDRKSVFVGHAAAIEGPEDVPQFMAYLLQDRKIARATHNILSWRCRTSDGVLHQDNDEDGETAAGGRISHLLQILDAPNVAVVVSRWWGGIPLGPDRFKHINQCARDALIIGGFIQDSKEDSKPKKRGK